MTRAELEENRKSIEDSLELVRQAQDQFQEVLGTLEADLGAEEIDEEADYNHVTVDSLIEQYADDEEKAVLSTAPAHDIRIYVRVDIRIYVRVDELPERLENFTCEDSVAFETGRTTGVPGWKEEESDASA